MNTNLPFYVFIVIFSVASSLSPPQQPAPYFYIHSGGENCDSFYSYQVRETSLNESGLDPNLPGTVTANVIIRKDTQVPNALLFLFQDWKVSYANATIGNKLSKELLDSASFPVRVIFKENGDVEKYQFNENETETGFDFKASVVEYLPIDWTKVRAGLATGGAKEFNYTDSIFYDLCKIKTSLDIVSEAEFRINSIYKTGDCAATYKDGKRDERFELDNNKWHMDFNESQPNLYHFGSELEFYYADDTIYPYPVLIKVEIDYKGCHKYEGEFNTAGLKDLKA